MPQNNPQLYSSGAKTNDKGKKGNVNWLTPKHILDRAVKTMGKIDLDPCAESEGPPFNVPAEIHLTKEDDGLSMPWFGRVFMNPPYGKGIIEPFFDKLLKEFRSKRVKQAIVLVASRTETQWYNSLNEFPRCHVKGRLKFTLPNCLYDEKCGATFPSTVFYLSRGPYCSFYHAFSDVGNIFTRLEL